MFTKQDYKKQAEVVTEWIDRYFKELETFPVKSSVRPGEVLAALPKEAPESPEGLSEILSDLDRIIMPGITHWQHPGFHAYFPANSSVESVLAENITTAIGAQCMIWETSPAAAELEERMLDWLKNAMGLPANWEGVIQDTASTATLAAILTARETATGFRSNDEGVPQGLRVYCSTETHSSIEKAVGIAGIGRKNLVKIEVDAENRMVSAALEKAIRTDIDNGLRPCCVVSAVGTTGTVAVDPVDEIGKICQSYGVWHHIDAAYAGTALLLPEYRWMVKGIEQADSFVFNPHKWMFTNFDCTAYYVKDSRALVRTFEILPEYLRTTTRGTVNDYRDWGIPLGRRFRALKLWFVLRGMGLQAIRDKLRFHISLNQYFADHLSKNDRFRVVSGPFLNFTGFTLAMNMDDQERWNTEHQRFINAINASGKVFLSHTKKEGRMVLRCVIGQTYVEKDHVDSLLALLNSVCDSLVKND